MLPTCPTVSNDVHGLFTCVANRPHRRSNDRALCSINANLEHKWIKQYEEVVDPVSAFVPVVLTTQVHAPRIGIETQRGAAQTLMCWPTSETRTCAAK